MANEPKPAKDKGFMPERQNAQGDHEGSAHSPDEFDVINPQKQGLGEAKQADHYGKAPNWDPH